MNGLGTLLILIGLFFILLFGGVLYALGALDQRKDDEL